MSFRVLATFGAALLTALPALNAQLPGVEGSSSPGQKRQDVRYLYPEQITVAANKPATVELHFQVNPGMHINSHTPSDQSLIPTRIAVEESADLNVTSVDFPAGANYVPQYNPKLKLNVYTGEFVLVLHLKAKPGNHLLQAAMRYQACDANACYPPRSIPVPLDVVAK